MSIDARIVGVRIKPGDVSLVLERSGRGRLAGQHVLTVENPPNDPKRLESLIGELIWGSDSQLLIGQTKFADRTGYTTIRLVDPKKGGDA